MYSFNKLIHFLIIILLGFKSYAQTSSLQVGTQIPLVYTLGYEFKTKGHLAFNAQVGVLTKPYDKAILNVLKMFGTEEAITNTIGNAFSYGIVLQPTVKYTFKKYYAGLSYSYYALVANETPIDAIESYYDITIPFKTSKTELTLKSKLSNAGITFGRYFGFKNSRLKIITELGIAKTFLSSSTINVGNRPVPILSDLVDVELNNYYISYGYLPSVNIFIQIPLNKVMEE